MVPDGMCRGELMRRVWVVMVLTGAAVVWCAAPSAVARAGTWGTAIEVPGLGLLNQGGQAGVRSVSCPTAGNCTAGGFYRNGSGFTHAFVVRETKGTWATAKDVPGADTLAWPGIASVDSVSCATAGSCGAIGTAGQPFVVSRANGTWGNAIKVPGFDALTTHGAAGSRLVSCGSAGNCAGAGSYLTDSFGSQAFVVSETNGTWGNAVKVPGLGSLHAGGAAIAAVSCATAGNCVAGGNYRDNGGHRQALVVSQVNGTWRKAIEVPGSRTLNQGGFARVHSVSCPSAGNCVAGGIYRDSAGHTQAFVVRKVNGIWRRAFEVPGSGTANQGGFASVDSVSCATVGNCVVAGYYYDRALRAQVFVASQTNGTWSQAIPVSFSLNPFHRGTARSNALVSCATAGNCAVGLTFTDDIGLQQVFVASETDGDWGLADEIPGLATLNAGGNASIASVSCGSAGNCAVVGTYTDAASHTQAFVVSQA
jgi:hypothetical protein